MYCPKCHAYVSDAARFCGKCGMTITPTNNSSHANTPQPTQRMQWPVHKQASIGRNSTTAPPNAHSVSGFGLNRPGYNSSVAFGAITEKTLLLLALDAVMMIMITFAPWFTSSRTSFLYGSGNSYSFPAAFFDTFAEAGSIRSQVQGLIPEGTLSNFIFGLQILSVAALVLYAVTMWRLGRTALMDLRGMPADDYGFKMCIVLAAFTVIAFFVIVFSAAGAVLPLYGGADLPLNEVLPNLISALLNCLGLGFWLTLFGGIACIFVRQSI